MAKTRAKNQHAYGDMLAQLLSKRLSSDPASASLPLVVENQVRPVGTAHVVVIWDAWRDQPWAERSRVITKAYESARSLKRAADLVPLGLTAAEGLSLGYLPYRIVPLVRKGDKVSARSLVEAMKSAGGVFTQIGAESRLRFATMEQAQSAYRRLLNKVPGPFWTLIHEQSPAESA